MLPTGLVIGVIPTKKLIKAFNGVLEEDSSAHSSTTRSRSRSPNATPNSSQSDTNSVKEISGRRELTFRDDEFKYLINWNDLPRSSVKALAKADQEKREADDKDVRDLILALAPKIIRTYQDFQKIHPHVTQKTPGIRVSEHVSMQVVKKFPNAMKEVLNGKVFGDGVDTFKKSLNLKIENDLRNKPGEDGPSPTIIRGVGVPGVLREQHAPHLTRKERSRQTVIHLSLSKIHEEDPDIWDWAEIKSKMVETYELQREHICEVTKKIIEAPNEMETEDSESDADEKAMTVLKREWPFLFFSVTMNAHYKRLTGIDLQKRLETFLRKDQFKHLLHFFCCCSSCNTVNFILKLKTEENSTMTVGVKFLVGVCMIANHFQEQYVNSFLVKAERTLTHQEVETIPELQSNICLIALGDNYYTADKYLICIDKVCVAEKTNALDTIVMLIELCYIFDIEYPPGLTKTFEFLERIIFEMTPKEGRVKTKKGKVLLVLTDAVKKTGKAFQDFLKQVGEGLEMDD